MGLVVNKTLFINYVVGLFWNLWGPGAIGPSVYFVPCPIMPDWSTYLVFHNLTHILSFYKLSSHSCHFSSNVHEAGQQTSPAGQPQPLMPISTNPLQVQKPSDPKPRPPTLQECEIIIRHLKDGNERQAHEVSIHLYIISLNNSVTHFHRWLILVCIFHMSLWMLQTKTSDLWKVS